jgi:NADH-quinone oxidoreductase subunit N
MSETTLAMLAGYRPVLPEVALVAGALLLLMIGAFFRQKTPYLATFVAIATLALAAGLTLLQADQPAQLFGGRFVVDAFGSLLKLVTLVASAVAIFMSYDHMQRRGLWAYEFPVLLLLATSGMMLMISASDLITLYLGLELQSLALYVVAAFNRNSERSSEAGLKYFVLGALSSGLLLYGASLIYGVTGTTNFAAIAQTVKAGGPSLLLVFGLVFLLAGLIFKISAVPFHMWTPDVYEGSPTPVTAFFAAAPKVAAMGLIIRVLYGAFPAIALQWQQIIVFVSIMSMLLGAFAAIGQSNIKRLMAYSSIGHMGFALVGVAAGTELGVRSVIIYLVIYSIMSLGTFACILAMRRDEGPVENIGDLAGLARNDLPMAFILAMLMFSLAGIPPLAGFFAKFYVLLAAVEANMVPLAVIGVLASVVGAFYYLRIVKVMFFDDPAEEFQPMHGSLRAVMLLAGLFVLAYVVYPTPLVSAAEQAARSIFPIAAAQ